MPRIEITEKNNTSPGSFVAEYDIAYVPGLVGIGGKLKYREKRLFTSITEFTTYCGEPVQFKNDQKYSSLTNKFSATAVPFDDVMFKEGAYDPGYLYAIELLGAGLGVLYERINPDKVKVDGKPSSGTYYGKHPTYKKFIPFKNVAEADAVAFHSLFEDGAVIGTTKISLAFTTDPAAVVVSGTSYSDVYALINGEHQRVEPTLAAIKSALTAANIQFTEKQQTLEIVATETSIPFLSFWGSMGIYTKAGTGKDIYAAIPENLNSMPSDWYAKVEEGFYGLQSAEAIEVASDSELATGKTLTDTYYYESDTDKICTIDNIYNELGSVYVLKEQGLASKSDYSVKYLTSGGYPVYEYNNNTLVTAMMNLAANRGDCIALIDHTYNPDRESDITLDDSLYGTVKNDTTFSGENTCYATMFTPSAEYNITALGKSAIMPASFGYLLALGNSIQTNASWLAIAGAARGGVPNLAKDGMKTIIPNGVADLMQKRDGIAINAITNIKPYGYTIWGNRTLRKNTNLDATSFLNVRNLISDVKKLCYQVSRTLTFEQDNDVLWVNFKGMIAPTLDRMVSGYGISGYKIVRNTSHPNAADKATLCAKIELYPVYPVEDFYIDIILSDTEVVVE